VYQYSAIGYNDNDFNSISYGTSCVVGLLCKGIQQGTQGNQRIGRRIFLRGVKIYLPTQNYDSYNNVRMIMVQPKGQMNLSTNGTVATDILSGAASGATRWAYPVDTDRFHVFYDKTLVLTGKDLNGSSTVNEVKFFKTYIKINKMIEYDGEGNTANAIKEIYLLGISDSAAVGHPGCIAGHVKLFFQDA